MKKHFVLLTIFLLLLTVAFACTESDDDSSNSAQTDDDDFASSDDDDDMINDDDAAGDDDDITDDDDTDDDDSLPEPSTELIDGGYPVQEISSIAIGQNGERRIAVVHHRSLILFTVDDTSYTSLEIAQDVSYPWLAQDTSGALFISFYDIKTKEIKLATNHTGSWTIETVGQIAAEMIRMTVDASDNVYISFFEPDDEDLYFATNANGNWNIEVVDTQNDDGMFNSIAVDSSGFAHIAYRGYSSLKYTTNSTGTWETTIVDDTDTGLRSSIAVDSNDFVHIGYISKQGTSKYHLKYATNKSGVWVTEALEETVTYGWAGTALALDDLGFAHLSHVTLDHQTRYFTNKSGSWIGETIEADNSNGRSIALDSNGHSYVAYYSSDQLTLAENKTGIWNIRTFDTPVFVAGPAAAARDQTGNLYVLYVDETHDETKLAVGTSGNWQIESLGPSNSLLYQASVDMEIDNQGYGHAVFTGSEGLVYSTNKSGTWTPENLGINGDDCAIHIDQHGFAHVASNNNYSILYCTNTSGNWECSTIDCGNVIALTPDVTVDSNGTVYISYSSYWGDLFGDYYYRLKFLTDENSNWQHQIADDSNSGATSIFFDDQDRLNLIANGPTQYIRNGNTWNVEHQESGGSYCDATLNENGALFTSCSSMNGIHVATNLGGTWNNLSLDPGATWGQTAIVADGNTATVAYASDGALWLTTYDFD